MSLFRRLTRWLIITGLLFALAFGISGRVDLLMLDAFLGVCSVLLLAGIVAIDPDLARERGRHPGYREYAARVRFRLLPGAW